MTDAIKALTENTSSHIVPGVGPVEYGTRMGERWYDPAGKNREPEEKPQTADEIALGVISRAGLTAKRSDSP